MRDTQGDPSPQLVFRVAKAGRPIGVAVGHMGHPAVTKGLWLIKNGALFLQCFKYATLQDEILVLVPCYMYDCSFCARFWVHDTNLLTTWSKCFSFSIFNILITNSNL